MTRHAEQRIDVTEEDIEQAIRADSGKCWVAHAIRKQIPSARHVIVDLQTIRFTSGRWRKTFLTPRRVQTALIAFDQGAEMRHLLTPFTFRLQDPIHKARVRTKGQTRISQTIEDKPVMKSAKTHGRPTQIGGPAPPESVLSSRQGRRYGLRVLKEMPIAET